MNTALRIERVAAERTRALRQSVLRPHQQASELLYPGDDWDESGHFAVILDDRIVGVASVYPMGPDGGRSTTVWRLRGMATAPSIRGTGAGRRLFEATVAHARANGGCHYWCNARTTAVGFYERMGMHTVGDEFHPPGIGPHFVMELELAD